MESLAPNRARAKSVIGILRSSIAEATRSNITHIDIRQMHDRVVVRGRARSYYAWQLALAACQRALAGLGKLELDCRFDVATDARKFINGAEAAQRTPENLAVR